MTRSTWLATACLAWVCGCSGATGGAGPLNPRTADADGDGWTPAEGDCDDDDPTRYPGAIDPPGDGTDQDCDGQDLLPLKAVGLKRGELIVTEVQRDPLAVNSNLGEWFELYNTTDMEIDLQGLVIRDLDSDWFEVDQTVVVAPGDYVVIGGWDDPAVNGGAEVDLDWGGELTLSNGEDELILEIPGPVVIDEFYWNAQYEGLDGESLLLDPGALDGEANDDPDNWCPARQELPYGLAGWGSPGAENPLCEPPPGVPLIDVEPGDLVITEIMQNPAIGDGDDGEWFEFTNTTTELINLTGLVFSDDGGNTATLEEYIAIAPGEYLVFGGSDDQATNGGVNLDWAYDNAVGLANSEDAVILRYGTVVFDEVAYDNGLTFPDPDGMSMSLDPGSIDATANDDGTNWCAGSTVFGAGDLGSPGDANPPCP